MTSSYDGSNPGNLQAWLLKTEKKHTTLMHELVQLVLPLLFSESMSCVAELRKY